jgi:hypothetical protein
LAALDDIWLRRGFSFCSFLALARLFGFRVARRFGSLAAFGFLWLIRFGSGKSTLWARQAGCERFQLLHNKALHPTAYSLRSFLAPASGGG